MGKGKGGKPQAPVAKGSERHNGKALKKSPKTGREGANGKTTGGYSPERLEIRAAIRRSARSK